MEPGHGEPDGQVLRQAQFTTTHWSVVLAAGQTDSVAANAALEQLCRTYWYPLYAHIRHKGHPEQDAKDLTQGFFATLLRRHAWSHVVAGRGKFRSWLLTALNHFLNDEHDRQQAIKRGGGQQIISFDAQEAEHRYQLEPADGETPDKLFDRRWATALIDTVLCRLETEFRDNGKIELFTQLRRLLVEGAEDRSYAETAAQLGLTEAAVRKAVQRLRVTYRKAILHEIAQTVSNPADAEEELRHLFAAFSL